MTKHRLLKIAASFAVAPFYGLAWCVGVLVRTVMGIMDAVIAGFLDALWGRTNAAN